MQKSSPFSAPLLYLYGDARYTLYNIYPLRYDLKHGGKGSTIFWDGQAFGPVRYRVSENLRLRPKSCVVVG